MSKKLTVAVKEKESDYKLFMKSAVVITSIMSVLIVFVFVATASKSEYKKSMAWDYAVETNNETCKMLVKDYYEDEAFENEVKQYTDYLFDIHHNNAERNHEKEAEFKTNQSQYAVDTCGVVIVNY